MRGNLAPARLTEVFLGPSKNRRLTIVSAAGEVIYSAPGYTALVDAGAALGAKGVPIPLNARLQNDLPALAAAVGERTIAVNLVNPHNPSGTVDDTAALDGFIRAVAPRALVVIDEAYLECDDLEGRSAISHVRAGANVLVFRTLAKAYGLAGLSIGYVLATTALAQDLRKTGLGSPHSPSWPITRRGFPTDLPMVGPDHAFDVAQSRRGFPTDLPMVGLLDGNGWNCCDFRGKTPPKSQQNHLGWSDLFSFWRGP